MIEYALLIMLGFCIGGLIALLLAPTLWNRAVRLTTRRLEATMPMSLSDIEADKDLLRASYAIRLRRMEAALNKARDKSANQLVEISRHQMRIAELNSGIDLLNAQLDERRNAANVFESTIRKRFPELEGKVAVAQAALDERASEIADLMSRLTRREEALEMAQRSVALQQDEIRVLRDTLDRSGADKTGRFKKRASQWTLDEYRSEYDRLNGELSRIREQLILAQERENRQVSVLRTELQQLAERIMLSASAVHKPAGERREAERQPPLRTAPPPPAYRPQTASARRSAAHPAPAPRPWPGEKASSASARPAEAAPVVPSAGPKTAEPKYQRRPAGTIQPSGQESKFTGPASPIVPARHAASTASAFSEPANSSGANISEGDAQAAARDSLKSLLSRGEKLAGDLLSKAVKAPAAAQEESEKAKPETAPSPEGEASAAAGFAVAEAADAPETSGPAKTDAKLDQVFREILEGRSVPAPEASVMSASTNGFEQRAVEAAEQAGDAVRSDTRPDIKTEIKTDKPATAEGSKTQTLLDRLRDMHERQTG